MRLAVIIINWNHHEATWQRVLAVKGWHAIKPEIIIVDNASSNRSGEHHLKLRDHTILIEPDVNLGFAGGNNLGIRKAIDLQAEHVMLLNGDAELKESDADLLLQALEKDRNIGAIGPLLQNLRTQKTYAGARDPALYTDSRIEWDPNLVRSTLQDVDYVPGTVFLARTSLFKEAGLLDEAYFFGGSIADWCFQIRQLGYRCYIHIQVQSQHRASDPSDLRSSLYVYYSLRNRFLFLEKWHSRDRKSLRRRWWCRCIRQLIGALVRGRFRKSRAIWLALHHGRRGSFGDQNHLFLKPGL